MQRYPQKTDSVFSVLNIGELYSVFFSPNTTIGDNFREKIITYKKGKYLPVWRKSLKTGDPQIKSRPEGRLKMWALCNEVQHFMICKNCPMAHFSHIRIYNIIKRRICQVAKTAKICSFQKTDIKILPFLLTLVEYIMILRLRVFADFGKNVQLTKQFIVKSSSENGGKNDGKTR